VRQSTRIIKQNPTAKPATARPRLRLETRRLQQKARNSAFDLKTATLSSKLPSLRDEDAGQAVLPLALPN
jgi:hypothetical protein